MFICQKTIIFFFSWFNKTPCKNKIKEAKKKSHLQNGTQKEKKRKKKHCSCDRAACSDSTLTAVLSCTFVVIFVCCASIQPLLELSSQEFSSCPKSHARYAPDAHRQKGRHSYALALTPTPATHIDQTPTIQSLPLDSHDSSLKLHDVYFYLPSFSSYSPRLILYHNRGGRSCHS